MPWPFRHGRTVTITRYTVNQRTQEKTPEDVQPDPLESCAWDPGSTSIEGGVDLSVTTSPTVYGPYGVEIRDTDELAVEGVDGVWFLDGEVLRHRNDLTATEACSEIKLTRKRGAQ